MRALRHALATAEAESREAARRTEAAALTSAANATTQAQQSGGVSATVRRLVGDVCTWSGCNSFLAHAKPQEKQSKQHAAMATLQQQVRPPPNLLHPTPHCTH